MAKLIQRLMGALCVCLALSQSVVANEKPNFLFIAVDDLRPELNCYGATHISSPNIDGLAASGVLFERAYCMVPTCGASRSSLLSGIRPAHNRFTNSRSRVDEDAPGMVPLNAHFRNNGYHAVSLGKVFDRADDHADGWSDPPWREDDLRTRYALPENAQVADGKRYGTAYEIADVPDDWYNDGRLADRAVADLRRLSAMDQPFFLAVGFWKPHLPFLAPKRYWDLYDPEAVHLPDNYWPPEAAPEESIHQWGELRFYSGIPDKGPLDDAMARTLIRGYYACVSYTDALVGRLLDELDRLGLTDDTIVVLWGDHGWNLGEHTLWCKHSCFEVSMRPAFIIRAPGYAAGAKTRAIMEYIDVYPTLCDLARIPQPDHLEGKSFVPVLRDPTAEHKPWAIGRWQDGETIRTDAFRYTVYQKPSGDFIARMLYDHHADPGENTNVSERPEHGPTLERLHETLIEHMGKPRRE